jgi:alanine racemase
MSDDYRIDVGKIFTEHPFAREILTRLAASGHEAVLIGKQGKERISAEEAASRIGTISYEVLAQLGKRVSRVYR